MAATIQEQTVQSETILRMAAMLLSDGENKEYDRAIVELVSDTVDLGIDRDDAETAEKIIRSFAY